jgi:pimeloyl-ACP methyl ester carboxylesterase
MLTADPTASASFFDDAEEMPADLLVEHGVDRYLTRTASAQLIWPIPEFGISDRLHLVKNPVTLVHGAKDEIIPASYLGKWAQLLPNVVGAHLIEEAGHQAEFDRPEDVAAIAKSALS